MEAAGSASQGRFGLEDDLVCSQGTKPKRRHRAAEHRNGRDVRPAGEMQRCAVIGNRHSCLSDQRIGGHQRERRSLQNEVWGRIRCTSSEQPGILGAAEEQNRNPCSAEPGGEFSPILSGPLFREPLTGRSQGHKRCTGMRGACLESGGLRLVIPPRGQGRQGGQLGGQRWVCCLEQIKHALDLMAAITDGVRNEVGEGPSKWVRVVTHPDPGTARRGQDAAGQMPVHIDDHIVTLTAEPAREGEEASVAAPAGFGPIVDPIHIRVMGKKRRIPGAHTDIANVLRTMRLPRSDGGGKQNRVSDESCLDEEHALRMGAHAAKIRRRIHLSFADMARWIALDIGGVRTGVAVTDRDALIASPLTTCATTELLAFVEQLVAEEPCAGFVMGHAGPDADSTPMVESWKKKLQKAFPGKRIEWVDEAFSSREAREAMVFGGMKKKKRQQKGQTDRIAAALILQRFLDSPASRA